MTKVCTKCKQEKSYSEFYKDKDRKDGYNYRCISCVTNYQNSTKAVETRHKWYNKNKIRIKKRVNEWRRNNPEKVKISKRKDWLKRNYGMTLGDYNKMFQEQKGCCAMCGKHQFELNRVLAVDHSHYSNKVRSLLCDRCNIGLGFIEDKGFMSKAKKYLNEYDSV